MKTIACGVLIGLVAVFAASAARSQDPPQPPRDGPSMEDMMKTALALAAPGEEHKLLAKLAGEWKVTGNSFFVPGMPPIGFTGTTNNTMILGGRFLQLEGEYESEEPKMQVQSMTVQGFDKRSGKYTLWGIDTMGTYSVSAEGDYDAASQTWTLHGETEAGPMGRMPFKFVIQLKDDAHYVLELHMEYPGIGWHKQMEANHEKL